MVFGLDKAPDQIKGSFYNVDKLLLDGERGSSDTVSSKMKYSPNQDNIG